MPIYVTPQTPAAPPRVTSFTVQVVHPHDLSPARARQLLYQRLHADIEVDQLDIADVVRMEVGLSEPVTTVELKAM